MFLPKTVAKGLMSAVFVVRMVASEGQKNANIASPSMMHCFGESFCLGTRIKSRNTCSLFKWDPLESTCRHASLSIL